MRLIGQLLWLDIIAFIVISVYFLNKYDSKDFFKVWEQFYKKIIFTIIGK